MEWWSFFHKVRKVVFAVTAIFCLLWTILLSIYLTREWKNFYALQRGIIFAMIGVNGFSSVMLYLMIVVVFRYWTDLARMSFLLAIHLGSTVPYTLFTSSFSCASFSSHSFCNVANALISANAWFIIGLFLCYAVFLLAIYRAPRPAPNAGLDLSSLPKTTSWISETSSSVTSATELLKNDVEKNAQPSSPASIYSQGDASILASRTFVVSTAPRGASPVAPNRLARPVGSYGAMGRPRLLPTYPTRVSSLSSLSTSSGTLSPAPSYTSQLYYAPSGLSNQGPVIMTPVQRHLRPQGRPRPLLLNPFPDPQPRNDTPDTALTTSSCYYSTESDNSANAKWISFSPSGIESGHVRSLSVPDSSMLLPTYYAVPFQLQPGLSTASRTGISSVHTYSAPPSMYYDRQSALYTPFVGPGGVSSDVPLRSQTTTPGSHSIHSLTPSLHFVEEGVVTKPPPSAHVRAASVPLPSPCSPGLSTLDDPMTDLQLPNPHAEMVAPGIHRYSSLVSLHTSAQTSRPAAPAVSTRTLAHPEWRQLVMSAALTP